MLPITPVSVSADQICLLESQIRKTHSRSVLELGSGTSTAFFVRLLENGVLDRFLSLEGVESYGKSVRAMLDRANLLNGRECVVFAPYKNYEIDGELWLWYDMEHLQKQNQQFDLVFVDGPPGALRKLSRYPAVPLLWNYLKPDSYIILDDGNRPDERKIVARWCEEFPELTAQYVDTLKGTWILHRKGDDCNYGM